jgi:lysophospholipase L1-like esterase
VVTVAPAVLTASTATAGGGVRVLLTGDSITHGRHGDYTWRFRLAQEFQRQGVPFDFVGSWSAPYQDPGFAPSVYANPNFDTDHFARAGGQLRDMAQAIEDEVATQKPDVIVLEAGINDLLRGQTVAQVEGSLRSWISAARKGKSGVRIVLASVLTTERRADTGQSLGPSVAKYDADLPRIAATMSTLQSPVTVARTNQGWTPSALNTTDGLHPTPTGETFIAQRVAEELLRVGILHSTPAIYRIVPWQHEERPVVTFSGKRQTTTAMVSWSRQAVTAAKVRVQQVGGALQAPAIEYFYGSARFPVVRGATYDVSVQLMRGTMAGPWGPMTRIRVPLAPSAPAQVTVTEDRVRWTASPGATAYEVQYRLIGRQRWVMEQTATLRLRVPDVKLAKVRALSAVGPSAWSEGVSEH